MHIIFETRSLDGNISAKEVRCTHFYGKDNVRIKNGPEQDVIICKLVKNGTISIAFFGSRNLRDKALEDLKRSSSSIVFLEFNKYFTYEPWDDEWAIHLCKSNFRNFSLAKTISMQIEKKIKDPENTDAFKDLGLIFINAMQEGRLYKIEDEDKYSRLWAKCLWTPTVVISKGISPRQYFLYLIRKNNEKLNSNNSNT